MKKVVHIMPVGHTKRTLIEGMRQFPFHKVILVLGKDATQGEEKAGKIAREIENELGKIAEVEYLYVDVDDVYSAAIDIAKTIRKEEKQGNEVKVNASGSLRTVGISCYLARALAGGDLYVAVPSYENNKITGIRTVLNIPAFPIKDVGKEELLILRFLLKKGSSDSVDELIQNLKNTSKSTTGYQNERARMSYHIKKLREGGFIETIKQGKNLRVALTKLGELYSIGKA